MTRSAWVALAVASVVLVALVGGGALTLLRGAGDAPDPTTASPPTAPATPTPTEPEDGSEDGPEGGEDADTDTETLGEQVERVAGVVAEVRGHDFDAVPEPVVLPPDELTERVHDELEAYTAEDADLDALLLTALGVLDAGTDLRALLVEAYGEQVAGFYDPDTGELVVSGDGDGERLGPVDELTLAHELQHALADQVFGIPTEDEVPEGEEDEEFARAALIEGDATVTMGAYAEVGLSAVDRMLLLGELEDLAAGMADATQLPYLLQRQLEFPYVEGAAFVSALLQSGGWDAVDAAYAAPPTSTAAILDPGRYLAGEQVAPEAPRGRPGPDWERARTLDLGAVDLLYLFEAPADDPARALEGARHRALAWTSGAADQWRRGSEHALAVALTGDVEVLCGSLDAWYSASFPDARRTATATGATWDGEDQDATLACDDAVRLGMGPDADTADTLAAGDAG